MNGTEAYDFHSPAVWDATRSDATIAAIYRNQRMRESLVGIRRLNHLEVRA